jgi:hypothetical protein
MKKPTWIANQGWYSDGSSSYVNSNNNPYANKINYANDENS